MIKSKIIKEVPVWILVSVFMGVVCAQFYVSASFADGIETSNYFALILSSMVFCGCALPLAVRGKVSVGWGDVAVVGFFVYIVINSFFYDSLDSAEFRMTTAYFSLYFAFKLVIAKYPEFVKYAIVAIMLTGLYQSILVLRQLYGFDYSNHSRFAVTGSFYNPGPCGIFLAAVLVLALAVIKNCRHKRSLTYITAYATIIATLLAVFPTMSRAGWIGAAVGIVFLYWKNITTYFKSKLMMIVLGSVALMVVVGVYVMKKDSADGRLFMWRNGVAAFAKSPVMGVGIGNFAENYSEAQYKYFLNANVLVQENKNIDVVGVPTSVFNEVVSLALLLGVVGIALSGFILYCKFSMTPMSCMVLSILVASLFSYTFYIPITVILFIFAIACMDEKRQFSVTSLVFLPLLLLPILNMDVKKEMKARQEWKNASMFYSMKSYDAVCEDYPSLLPLLNKNYKFMFEYGHSLNKEGRYEESNTILLKGARRSTDPMFWTIIGNNYLSMKQYKDSEESYLRSYYLCPNRLYPIYLLAKLGDTIRDTAKRDYYGTILIKKTPKVKSSATEEMKEEITKMLKNNEENHFTPHDMDNASKI